MKIENLTYEELAFDMKFETPIGESELTSYGGSGFKDDKSIFVNFHNGYHYTTKYGFETDEDQKAREWLSDYNELTKTQKSIIGSQFTHLIKNYSYCSQYGTTCFKYSGQKVMFPSATKIWKAIKLNHKSLRRN